MNRSPDEMSFTDDDFLDEGGIADGVLAFDDVLPEVDLTPNFAGGAEIASEVLIPTRSAPDTALLVEDTLLELLEHGKRDQLLVMTGEAPNVRGTLEPGVLAEFTPDYTHAVAYNPAIKWYGKLAKILSAEQFSLVNGALNLAMPPELYRKVLHPFLGDFREEFADASPLVAVVRNLMGQMAAHGVEASRRNVARTQAQSRTARVASDLDVAALDTNSLMADVDADDGLFASLGIDADTFGESVDFINTEEPTTKASRFKVTLADLSNKAVLEHVLGEDENPDPDAVEERLLDEGLEKSRVNEITGMLRYRLAHGVKGSRQAGNRGLGNVEFDFLGS